MITFLQYNWGYLLGSVVAGSVFALMWFMDRDRRYERKRADLLHEALAAAQKDRLVPECCGCCKEGSTCARPGDAGERSCGS